MTQKIRPTGFRVLVDCTPIEEVTEGGIVLPGQTHKRMSAVENTGTIVAFGPTVFIGYAGIAEDAEPEERAAQWGCKIGDVIQFGSYQGHRYEDNEGDQRLVDDENIIAVLEA